MHLARAWSRRHSPSRLVHSTSRGPEPRSFPWQPSAPQRSHSPGLASPTGEIDPSLVRAQTGLTNAAYFPWLLPASRRLPVICVRRPVRYSCVFTTSSAPGATAAGNERQDAALHRRARINARSLVGARRCRPPRSRPGHLRPCQANPRAANRPAADSRDRDDGQRSSSGEELGSPGKGSWVLRPRNVSGTGCFRISHDRATRSRMYALCLAIAAASS
ncbi:hypothetical protein SAMN05216338_108115 [Bradyrhizobium sp. Rc2d]|nr:hypothetical protein SAMN05216338_108115 [Bradyrhizobium sp. Rc2d]